MNVEEATGILWQSMQTGDHAPAALRKTLTLADAYQIQFGILDRWLATGEKQAGWKIGATSGAAREMLKLTAPAAGYLLASRRFSNGETFQHEKIYKPIIESEVCIIIGKRLAGPGVTRDDVLAAVSGVAPAFEIAAMRSDMASDFPLGLADDIAQWGYVIGSATTPYPKDLDLGEMMVESRRNGEVVQKVRGRDAIDDQLQSVAWLANHVAQYGKALEPGHCIITGAILRPLPIAKGDQWETQFSSLGTVTATFA